MQTSIKLPCIADSRGKLVFLESNRHVPFAIRRFFAVYAITPGSTRADHAHRTCHEFLLVLAGSVTAELDDGRRRWKQLLSDPAEGLHVPPMTWLVLTDFSPDAVCGVLASEPYDETDYIRDYQEFLGMLAGKER